MGAAAMQPEDDDAQLKVKRAIVEYVKAGLSVIPVGGDKRPNFRLLPDNPDTGKKTWSPFQKKLVDFQTAKQWLQADPMTGLAIICGKISGNLAVLDVDDQNFSNWLKASAREFLKKTWVVETGSGKIHIYVRSTKPVISTVHKHRGTKLTDLRSDGEGDDGTVQGAEYVVAPPSPHPSGGTYRTLHGKPGAILEVPDAKVLFDKLVNAYTQTLEDVGTVPESASNAVAPPPANDLVERVIERIKATFDAKKSRTDAAVARAIQHGATPAEGFWKTRPTFSEVDFVIVKELRRKGFNLDEIRVIFSHPGWKVGLHRYRDPKARSSSGERYLTQTIRNADRELRVEKQAQSQAVGENFTITHVKRVGMGDESWLEITLRIHAGQADATVRVDWARAQAERTFKSAVGGQCKGFWPIFKAAHTGRDFEKFLALLIEMAEHEPLPEDATDMGLLATRILGILASYRIKDEVPQGPDSLRLGWRDSLRRDIHFKNERLMAALAEVAPRSIPKQQDVWYVLRGLGAREQKLRIGKGVERVWTIPATVVDCR